MTASDKEITANLAEIKATIPPHVTLVAVSKTHPSEAIEVAYRSGHRVFGENKVQEMEVKATILANDIQWHLIGHLQSNKVKYIAPFVTLIHAVDSEKLLDEIQKRAAASNRVIDVLLQVHIAAEETKFGFDAAELNEFLASKRWANLPNVRLRGLMGMATFTNNESQVRSEFRRLKSIFDASKMSIGDDFDTLSMGMSGDYQIAIEEGSTMVRIGSSFFGAREYH